MTSPLLAGLILIAPLPLDVHRHTLATCVTNCLYRLQNLIVIAIPLMCIVIAAVFWAVQYSLGQMARRIRRSKLAAETIRYEGCALLL